MTTRLFSLVFLCSLISFGFGGEVLSQEASPQSTEEKRQLTIGIVPQQSASTLAAKWGPVLRRVSQESNIDLKFVTARNIPTFEARLAAGEYDLAYMNPYHYTGLASVTGYSAFAKEKGKRLTGIIVVPKESPISSLSDLDGQEVAFPAPAAFAASVIPQTIMVNSNIEISPKYVYSHDSVYMNVARGFLPAGGGVMRTLNATPEQVRDKIKIVWQSDGYTPHAFAAHERVSADDIDSIMRAFDTLSKDAQFAVLLDKLKLQPLEVATDKDWDDIRQLGITGFLVDTSKPSNEQAAN
jgi:phosphonate transport system substrate-binding protein